MQPQTDSRMRFSTWCPAITLAIAMGCARVVEGDDVASNIVRRLGWPANMSSIHELGLQGLEGCEIYEAYDKRVLDGVPIGVARLKDGRLIPGSEPDALDTVFARCVSAVTPAGTQAHLLVDLSNYAGLQVLEDNSLIIARDLMKSAGRKFSAPQISVEHGERVLRFLALSPDGYRLYQVVGHIGKKISIEVEQL